MKHILRCTGCGQYTMKETCPACKNPAVSPKPPKYSPEDKYGSYRRKAKQQEYKERGLV
ncbi:RNA-protein complex protein Nop10 [Candidatus Woesearchaeota archaeon]|nr:RNA-protein complex protein Nop10 [Candidatus Woesearchaeota archaeon]